VRSCNVFWTVAGMLHIDCKGSLSEPMRPLAMSRPRRIELLIAAALLCGSAFVSGFGQESLRPARAKDHLRRNAIRLRSDRFLTIIVRQNRWAAFSDSSRGGCMENKTVYKSFRYQANTVWSSARRGTLSALGKPCIDVGSPPEFKGEPDI
jgi:hypothetical protein